MSSSAREEADTRRCFAAPLLGLVAVLALNSCESLSSSGSDDAPVEIRQVITERAAFYDSYPAEDAIPFIYLTEGTPVQWLKEKSSFSRVKLANGSSGWVPSDSLGAPSYGDPQQTAADESSQPLEAAPGSGSSAIRAESGDDMLNQFNRP